MICTRFTKTHSAPSLGRIHAHRRARKREKERTKHAMGQCARPERMRKSERERGREKERRKSARALPQSGANWIESARAHTRRIPTVIMRWHTHHRRITYKYNSSLPLCSLSLYAFPRTFPPFSRSSSQSSPLTHLKSMRHRHRV